jgi:glycolate oxidase
VLKKEWLAREIGDVGIRLHQDIKRALDPRGILNPGKVFG